MAPITDAPQLSQLDAPTRDISAPALSAQAGPWLSGLAFSLALHLAPLGLLLWSREAPPPAASAGDSVVEIEMVIATEEIAGVSVTEAPTEANKDESATPPAADAAQAPEVQREQPQDNQDEVDIQLPIEDPAPVVFKDDDRLVSQARPERAVVAASTETTAKLDRSYMAQVAKRLAQFRRFPASMPKGRDEVRLVVSFTLEPDGALREAAVVQRSGSDAIDAEALALLRRAAPFPRPPTSMQGRPITAPITYRVRG